LALLAQYFHLGREGKMIKFKHRKNYNKNLSKIQEIDKQVALVLRSSLKNNYSLRLLVPANANTKEAKQNSTKHNIINTIEADLKASLTLSPTSIRAK
jgi:hypothetical protein